MTDGLFELEVTVPARPCGPTGPLPLPCPWRADLPAPPGGFPARLASREFADLCGAPGAEAPLGAPLFICHKSSTTRDGGPRIVCAGWLAVHGYHHLGVRLAVMFRHIPSTALRPGEGWPPLHPDYQSMVTAQVTEPKEGQPCPPSPPTPSRIRAGSPAAG